MIRRLHALYIMDRPIRWGMPRPRAQAIGGWWERRVHPVLYDSRCGIGAPSRLVLDVQESSHQQIGDV